MQTPFADQLEVRRFYWRWEKALLACLPGELPRVLCALSGGCDSTVLARMLCAARERGLCAVTLGHVHHGLRAEADREETFVRATAQAWGLGLQVERVDTLARARAAGQSIEQAARALRREALVRMARSADCACVALAHHMDDQAETVLMRILRGTGPRGLGAMAACEPWPAEGDGLPLIRPMLGFRRDEIRAIAARAGLTWVEDSSNRDPGPLRNRVRHELIPHLADAYNPRIVAGLADLAAWQREADAVILALAREAARRARGGRPGVDLDAAALAAEPEAVATRVLWLAYQELAGSEAALSSEHTRRLAHLVRSQPGAGAEPGAGAFVDLPGGVRAVAAGGRLRFEPGPDAGEPPGPVPRGTPGNA